MSETTAPRSVLTGVPGWETEAEQRALAYLAGNVPHKGTIVEIGAEYGMSTSLLTRYSTESVQVWAIDPFDESIFAQHRAAMTRLGVNHRGLYLNMTSDEAHKVYAKNDGAPIDLLFIDGDHSQRAVVEDIINWLPKVKIGGIVVFHDAAAYTNLHPHEQHKWVHMAIDSWRGVVKLNDDSLLPICDPADFVESIPVDSMRVFVRVGGSIRLGDENA